MKTFVIATLLLVMAATAYGQATPITDIQGGLYAEGVLVTPRGVVVAMRYNGIYIADAPFGATNGIWVYTGSDAGYQLGDIVQTCGVYKEYYDLSEVDIPAADIYGSLLKVGEQAVPAPSVVTAADLMANPEIWESCAITIQDGMQVILEDSPGVPVSSYGEWTATCLDGTEIAMDDYWYDATQVVMLECYNNATGIWNYGYGAFKLEPYVDGLALVNCTIPTEAVSFGAVKAMYR